MAYLKFNKYELGNLEYSLKREILATNRAGGYLNTTIIGCNTRKYHGLLVIPIDSLGGGNYVLLSTLDETLVQHDQAFNLGIHRYPGIYEPRGHKYIIDFELDRNIVLTYRIGGMIFRKEIVFVHNKEQVMLRYTLLDAHSPTLLRLRPFLAFRNVHTLTRANMEANTFHSVVDKGVGCCLYEGFPTLFMQLNVKNEFVTVPDWYRNIEYLQEKERGYDYHEDLFVPGYFECPLKKGQSVVFSASLQEINPPGLTKGFSTELDRRPERKSFKDCLKLAASQFIIRKGNRTEVVAGYPWFGRWGRDTFIALPGLTLAGCYDLKACKEVLDTMVAQMQNGLFPNIGEGASAAFNAADAPLWFFWTLQQYLLDTGERAALWTAYGDVMKKILRAYRYGTTDVQMHDNGLIWAAGEGKALTWMDAVVDGVPVTGRAGYAVEICALWYNAVCFTLELARDFGDDEFTGEFSEIPVLIKENFFPVFWMDERAHLADYVDAAGQNTDTRPNQLFACSLPFSPLSDEIKNRILDVCSRELLTPRGLRTLSPKNPLFAGRYEGNQNVRDHAYHQGTVWPWLLGHYIEAQFRIHGAMFAECARELVYAFEEDMTEHGVGSIPEVYDGDPPHRPHGCTSQAWSVAEILRSIQLIEKYQKQ